MDADLKNRRRFALAFLRLVLWVMPNDINTQT